MILDAFKFTNSLFVSNLTKILVVCSLPFFIQYLVYLGFSLTPGTESGIPFQTTEFLQQFISAFINVFAAALIILVVDDIYKQSSRSLSNYYFQALYYFPRLFLIGIAIGIIFIFGLFLIILPGIYFYGRLMFAQFIAIIENKSASRSIQEAFKLTHGIGWQVIGYLFALTIPLILIIIFVVVVTSPLHEYLSRAIILFFTFLYNVYVTIYMYHLLINVKASKWKS